MTNIPGITGGSTSNGTPWTCPFCNIAQVLTPPKTDTDSAFFDLEGVKDGRLGVRTVALSCANPECGLTTIGAAVMGWHVTPNGRQFLSSGERAVFHLRPRGREVALPGYVPEAIRRDYREAGLIVDLSPNASATLARRCLQGVLVDFAGVKHGLLGSQIKELRKMLDERRAAEGVTVRSLDAIEHVREFGNIGAHMEQPTGMVVDVEPEEAALLLELLGSLFRDWYIERHDREQRYARIDAHAAAKRQLRAEAQAERAATATKLSDLIKTADDGGAPSQQT